MYWSSPDGSEIREAAFPLDAPNGIGLSPDGDTVYVAETHTGRLWGWSVDGPVQRQRREPARSRRRQPRR